MFNRTEAFQIKMGRNERWPNHDSVGFTSSEKSGKPIRITKANSGISPKNRAAAMKAAKAANA